MPKPIQDHLDAAIKRVLKKPLHSREASGIALYEFTQDVLHALRDHGLIVPMDEEGSPRYTWQVETAEEISKSLRVTGYQTQIQA